MCVWLKLERVFPYICLQRQSAKVFISSKKGVCLQCQKSFSTAQNTFVASNKHVYWQCDSYLGVSSRDERVYQRSSAVWKHVWRWVAETASSLKINTSVFNLEDGLEIPQKVQKPRKKFLKKTSFQVKAGPVKRKGWEKSTTLRYYRMMAPSSTASNAMQSHP